MGEAKRRGTFEQRVASALEKSQTTMSTRAMRSQIELQEHMQRLEARRAQIEMHMGPMDKLHAQQSQVLREAADKLKQMEGVQIVAETNEAVVVSIASDASLGSQVIDVVPTEVIVETDDTTAHFDDITPLNHEPTV